MDRIRTVIVEDTDDVREMLRLCLAGHGHDVVAEAVDGREGIEVADRLQPDLVLLDLSMPVMGGLEALPHLRRSCPDTTIVVLSAHGADQMTRQVVGLGADGYIQKGTSLRALLARIDEFLSPAPA